MNKLLFSIAKTFIRFEGQLCQQPNKTHCEKTLAQRTQNTVRDHYNIFFKTRLKFKGEKKRTTQNENNCENIFHHHWLEIILRAFLFQIDFYIFFEMRKTYFLNRNP